jgi:hypothetical protein
MTQKPGIGGLSASIRGILSHHHTAWLATQY